MAQDSSARYYQNKEKTQKKNLVKNIKIFPKKKQYGREQYKNLSENEKNKNYLCIEKGTMKS